MLHVQPTTFIIGLIVSNYGVHYRGIAVVDEQSPAVDSGAVATDVTRIDRDIARPQPHSTAHLASTVVTNGIPIECNARIRPQATAVVGSVVPADVVVVQNGVALVLQP